jgi:hypothetical protein
MAEMNVFDKIKLSMDLDDPRRQNVEMMEQVVSRIPTIAGQKYALSKLLNDPKYGMTDPSTFKYQDYAKDLEDAWSVKHQEDYKAPDVVKAEEKRDKESFYNWDSPSHWSKKSTKDLERRAIDAGYPNKETYLKAVGDAQVQIDREKLFNDVPGTIAKIAYPRSYEAVMRGEDIQAKDLGLDVGEQALYAVNPGGRIAQAAKLGDKMGKVGKLATTVADIASNPAMMEAADAISYDDPNNARSEFNAADVAMGAGINAGMNRIANRLTGGLVAPKPVPKQLQTEVSEKARRAVAAEKAKATRDSKTVVNDMLRASRNGEDIAPHLQKLQELQLVQNKPNPKKEFRDRTIKDFAPEVKNALAYESLPFISNKAGDLISEDPRMAKRVVSRAVRLPGLNLAGPLVDAYYEAKENESEKKKLNRELGYE